MIHNYLTYIIAVLGIYAGTYVLINIKKLRNDWVLRFYFYVLGFMYLYIGIVYTLIIFGIIIAIPPTQAAILMRPINILAIATPFLIAKRMGL